MHKYSSSVVGKMTVFLGYNLSTIAQYSTQGHKIHFEAFLALLLYCMIEVHK